MNEKRLIEIIHRPGLTGGREEAARTAEICGGELAKLAEPIRCGAWPPRPVVDVPKLNGKFTLRILNAVFKDPLYGPQSAAELAIRAGWHSAAQKIRDGRWNPDKRPTNGDGAGIDHNDGRFNPPPKFLREKPSFDNAAARERSAQINREKKSRRPENQPRRWDPNVEKRRVQL